MQTISSSQRSRKPAERRRNPRVTPDPFLVIRLASGNTGVVLDVSHDGLGFLASAPVQETHAVHFEISGRAIPASAAAGQLMWKDTDGKRAGLQFTELPQELRALIRGCLPLAELPVAPEKKQKEPSPLSLAAEKPGRAVSEFPAKRLALVANTVTVLLACLIAWGIWHSLNPQWTLGSLAQGKQNTAGFLSLLRTAHGRIHLPARAKTTEPVSVEPTRPFARPVDIEGPLPIPAEVPFPHNPLAQGNSVPLQAAASPKSVHAAADEPAGRVPVTVEKQTAPSPSEDAGQTALALARGLLQKDADPENQAKAAQLLWQAVEKGNVPAEVELANLYLVGQGVAKSCSQARVLLTAAQVRKSTPAAKKLDHFSQYGCE
jgi:hypothetical protein